MSDSKDLARRAGRDDAWASNWTICALQSIVGLFLVLWPLDALVFEQRTSFWFLALFGADDGAAVLAMLSALFAANALVLDSLAASKIGDPRAVIRWVRWLRLIFMSLPLLGLYSVTAWLWVLEKHPDWVISKRNSPVRLSSPGSANPWRRLSQRYGMLFTSRDQLLGTAPQFFLGLLAINTLGLHVATLWLASFGPDLFGLSMGVLVSASLHALVFACTVTFLLARRHLLVLEPFRKSLLSPLALLWWLPAPFCILGALVVPLTESVADQPLLARSAYRRRQQWTRMGLKVYSFLDPSNRHGFGGESPDAPRLIRGRLKWFYQLKRALLPIEILTMTAGLIWFASSAPLWLLVAGVFSALALVGLMATAGVAAGLANGLDWRRKGRWASLGETAVAPFLLAVGLALGIQLGSANSRAFGGCLADLALFGLLSVAMAGVFKRRYDLRLLTWVGVFSATTLAGLWIAGWKTSPVVAALLLTLGGSISLLGTSLLAIVLGPWLLRPWTMSHLGHPGLSSASRRRVGVLVASLALPLGGLLIPFWKYARRRWYPLIEADLRQSSPGPDPGSNQNDPIEDKAQSPQRERSPVASDQDLDYSYQHLISHLVSSRNYQRLWKVLEETPFLADQASYSNGFLLSANDLESAVLPTAISQQDWGRFLRYALIALNLHGLADQLTDEGLLAVLARSGHPDLALDGAGRVADRSRRLHARKVVGRCLDRASPRFATLMEQLREDLEALPSPSDQGTAEPLRSLIELALAFGPELGSTLHGCVAEQLEPSQTQDAHDEIRLATAWCLHERRGGELSPDLWSTLSSIRSPQKLTANLPELLASSKLSPDTLDETLDRIRTLPAAEEKTLWPCRAAILSVLSKDELELAQKYWQSWSAVEPVPWSLELVNYAAGFLRHLEHEALMSWTQQIDDAEVRVFLLLVKLFELGETSRREGPRKERPTRELETLAAQVRATIDQLPPATQPSWLLPWIDALSPFAIPSLGAELERLAIFLSRASYNVPADDLVRFFDLVVTLRPKDLSPWMANAVIASETGPELLRALVEHSQKEAVLRTLLERAERYLLGFSLKTKEVTELWNTILTRLVARICVLSHKLDALEQARDKVPDEDVLRVAVGNAMAASGQLELANQVCRGVRNGRLRQLLQLQLMSAMEVTKEPSLAPGILYQALMQTDEVQDELRALAALHDCDQGADSLFRSYLEPMANPARQVPALIRCLKHRATWTAGDSGLRFREQQVGWHVLEQALKAGQPDETLVSLTPELPALSRPLGRRRAVQEFHESFIQLLRLSEVPWEGRLWGLESLLSQIGEVVLDPLNRRPSSRQERWAAALLRVMARQVVAEAGAGQETEDLLPILVTVAEHLPGVARRLGHPPFSPRRKRSWLPSPTVEGLNPEIGVRDQILSVCRAGDDLRLELAADVCHRRLDIPARTTSALVYLLSRHPTNVTSALLETLPKGPRRDRLALRLIQHGWVSPAVARKIMPLIEDTRDAHEAKLWCGLAATDGTPDESWIRDFATLTSRHAPNTDDLRYEPWLGALRKGGTEHSLPALAEAMRSALGKNSVTQIQRVLRIWLHAFSGGTADPLPILRQAIRQASHL